MPSSGAIKVQRRETATFWATVVVPVLSLLVALAAVLFRYPDAASRPFH